MLASGSVFAMKTFNLSWTRNHLGDIRSTQLRKGHLVYCKEVEEAFNIWMVFEYHTEYFANRGPTINS